MLEVFLKKFLPSVQGIIFHVVSFVFISIFFIVTLHPHPNHILDQSSNHSTSLPAGDQLVAEGVTHISLPLHKNTIEGDRRK